MHCLVIVTGYLAAFKDQQIQSPRRCSHYCMAARELWDDQQCIKFPSSCDERLIACSRARSDVCYSETKVPMLANFLLNKSDMKWMKTAMSGDV
jgi:hypothetical protein